MLYKNKNICILKVLLNKANALKRAFKSLEIQSTDCEYVSLNESMPLVLNNIDLEKELDDMQTRIIDSGTNWDIWHNWDKKYRWERIDIKRNYVNDTW